jgi:energy-coupling factor transport system substrate-specific component
MQSQGDFHVPGDVDTLRALGLPMTEGGTDVSAETRSVNGPTVVRGMVGAMLYGGLGFLSFQVPSAANASSLLALAIIPFFGIQFGAVAGFLTGALGNALLEQFHGGGLTLFWNWTIADGLVGMMAGLMGLFVLEYASAAQRVIRVAVIGVLAAVVGLTFTVTYVLMGNGFLDWLSTSYLPAVSGNGVAVLLFVPLLDQVWRRNVAIHPRRLLG